MVAERRPCPAPVHSERQISHEERGSQGHCGHDCQRRFPGYRRRQGTSGCLGALWVGAAGIAVFVSTNLGGGSNTHPLTHRMQSKRREASGRRRVYLLRAAHLRGNRGLANFPCSTPTSTSCWRSRVSERSIGRILPIGWMSCGLTFVLGTG